MHVFAYFTQDWKIGKLNHVAIAVPDLDQSVTLYKDMFGAKVSEKLVRNLFKNLILKPSNIFLISFFIYSSHLAFHTTSYIFKI